MIGLMLNQSIIGVVVQLLYQPDEHISDIVERAGDLDDNQCRCERQALRNCTVMKGAQIKRLRFGGKLLDLDIGNAEEGLSRESLLPKPSAIWLPARCTNGVMRRPTFYPAAPQRLQLLNDSTFGNRMARSAGSRPISFGTGSTTSPIRVVCQLNFSHDGWAASIGRT